MLTELTSMGSSFDDCKVYFGLILGAGVLESSFVSRSWRGNESIIKTKTLKMSEKVYKNYNFNIYLQNDSFNNEDEVTYKLRTEEEYGEVDAVQGGTLVPISWGRKSRIKISSEIAATGKVVFLVFFLF